MTLHAICATDKADFTLNAMQEEYQRWMEKGVTDQNYKNANIVLDFILTMCL